MSAPLLRFPVVQYAYVVPDLDEGIRREFVIVIEFDQDLTFGDHERLPFYPSDLPTRRDEGTMRSNRVPLIGGETVNLSPDQIAR